MLLKLDQIDGKKYKFQGVSGRGLTGTLVLRQIALIALKYINLFRDRRFCSQFKPEYLVQQPIFRGGGGGVSGLSLWKNDFELGVGGDGQDTSRHFDGSFGSIRAILPM